MLVIKKVHWLNILFFYTGLMLSIVFLHLDDAEYHQDHKWRGEDYVGDSCSFFLHSSCYAPWALNYYMVAKALSNGRAVAEVKDSWFWSSWPVQDRETWPYCCFNVYRAERSVGSLSWLLLKVADALKGEVEMWKRGEAYQSFHTFKHFVKKITCVCQWLPECNNRNFNLGFCWCLQGGRHSRTSCLWPETTERSSTEQISAQLSKF